MKLIGGNTLLWRGGLNVATLSGAGTGTPQTPLPQAADDAATVTSGGSVSIPVLQNDFNLDGTPLTVVSADAGSGSVAIETNGELTYSAPGGFTGTDTITYTVRNLQGGQATAHVRVDVYDLSISENAATGEFTVASAPGEFTVSIVEPAMFAGDYVISTADLDSGPINLVPPSIGGSGMAGGTLTVTAGLWAYNEADAPLAMSRQWYRGDAAIAGATGGERAVTEADAGHPIHVVEVCTTASGSRAAASGAVTVTGGAGGQQPWTPADLQGSLAVWLDASDDATVDLSGTEVTQWSDKSGRGRHLTFALDSVSPRPLAGPTVAGRKAIDFHKSGASGASLSTFNDFITGAKARTVLMAVGPYSRGEDLRCFLSFGQAASAGTSGARWSLRTTAGGYLRLEIQGGGSNSTTLKGTGSGLVGAITPDATLGSGVFLRNGQSAAIPGLAIPVNTYSGSSARMLLGRLYTGGPGDGAGVVCEVLVADADLSSRNSVGGVTDLQRAEGYLAHKWGFADLLPAAHPFRSSAPTQ